MAETVTFIQRVRTYLDKNYMEKAIQLLYQMPQHSPKLGEVNLLHSAQRREILEQVRRGILDERSANLSTTVAMPKIWPPSNLHSSVAVNPVFAAIFFLAGHIEKSGPGIRSAKETIAEAGLRPPVLWQAPLLKFSEVTIFK